MFFYLISSAQHCFWASFNFLYMVYICGLFIFHCCIVFRYTDTLYNVPSWWWTLCFLLDVKFVYSSDLGPWKSKCQDKVSVSQSPCMITKNMDPVRCIRWVRNKYVLCLGTEICGLFFHCNITSPVETTTSLCSSWWWLNISHVLSCTVLKHMRTLASARMKTRLYWNNGRRFKILCLVESTSHSCHMPFTSWLQIWPLSSLLWDPGWWRSPTLGIAGVMVEVKERSGSWAPS